MSTTLSKPYTHLAADFYKGIDAGGPYYLVRYLFDSWADSDTIINEMLGYTSRVGNATVRYSPHQHPLSSNLFCQNARVIGVGGLVANASGFPSYDGGFIVEAEYRASIPQGLVYDPGNNGQIDPTTPILWCTQELDFDTQVISFPRTSLYWDSGGTGAASGIAGPKTQIAYQQQISVTTMTLTFPDLPYFPVTPIRSLRGKLNNVVFLGAQAGCVLFVGGKSRRDVRRDGSVSQTVSLVFQEREYDWNRELKAPGQWVAVCDVGGTPRYTRSDLSPLVNL